MVFIELISTIFGTTMQIYIKENANKDPDAKSKKEVYCFIMLIFSAVKWWPFVYEVWKLC